jgi:hypothetical protein
VNARYGLEERNVHIAAISEERILMELKKYKEKIDVAIISHAYPMSVYFPSWNKDFISAKIPEERIKEWSEDEGPKWVFSEGDFFSERTMDLNDYELIDWSVVNEHMKEYRRLYFNADLQKNRYYGALMQISAYLKFKQIKTIHVARTDHIPKWFQFEQGIVDYEICWHQYKQPYGTTYSKSANSINEEGNVVIAEKLIDYIENYENYAIEYRTKE